MRANRKWTRERPNGETSKEIDFVLCEILNTGAGNKLERRNVRQNFVRVTEQDSNMYFFP